MAVVGRGQGHALEPFSVLGLCFTALLVISSDLFKLPVPQFHFLGRGRTLLRVIMRIAFVM